jgi:hypothetical protein
MKRKIAESRKSRSKSAEKSDGKLAFKPAALVKCDTFQKDKEIYGEDAGKISELVDEATEVFNCFLINS